jgi:hypothetical protein
MFESAGGDFGQWLSNLFSGAGSSNVVQGAASTGDTPSMAGADFSSMASAGYGVPSAQSTTSPSDSSGGMNWAGLSQGLGNLSKQLGGQSSGSNTLSDSKSVSSTVSGGTLSPAGGGSGASALASMLANRNQLAQALMLAAMQGKGRGKSGQGLLG